MFRKIVSLPLRALRRLADVLDRVENYLLLREYRAANKPHYFHELHRPQPRFFLRHGPHYSPYLEKFTPFTYY